MMDSSGTGAAAELTAEAFRHILDLPGSASASAIEHDKRGAPRTKLAHLATLLPFSERFSSDTLIAPLRDLSPGGFGFLHDRQIPLGEQFALLLPETSGRPIVILCTVAYWQPLGQDLFAIGARFCQVLRQSELGLPLVLEDVISGELTAVRKAS